MSKRQTKRTLVRWNDDHDKELLLWLVWCCNEQGIKIPFNRVAQCMGASFTEGACIQHLAKIRNKLEVAGLHVPPSQKRGSITQSTSSIYRSKPKAVNAPVPRIRPDTQSPTRTGGFYADSDEEEELEDLEQQFDPNSANEHRGQKSRKLPHRQSKLRKSSRIVKNDSDEDDPLPESFYEENGFGEKGLESFSGQDQQNHLPKEIEAELNLGGNTGIAHDGQAQDDLDVTSWMQAATTSTRISQCDPIIKRESFDDSMAPHIVDSNVPQQCGTRRKSSALIANGSDDEFEPDPAPRTSGRKPRAQRATNKKQKLDKKQKGNPKQQMNNVSEAGNQQIADRAAMPPPALPAASLNFDAGWNSNFVRQPFASANNYDASAYSQDLGQAAWNSVSPMSTGYNVYPNQPPLFDPYHPAMGLYQGSSIGYIPNSAGSVVVGEDMRHPSMASVSSSSTVETLPVTWKQPYRSPGFPNPREATMVCQAALNIPSMNAASGIDLVSSQAEAHNAVCDLEPRISNDPSTPLIANDSLFIPDATQAPQVSDDFFDNLPDNELNFTDFLAGDAGYH